MSAICHLVKTQNRGALLTEKVNCRATGEGSDCLLPPLRSCSGINEISLTTQLVRSLSQILIVIWDFGGLLAAAVTEIGCCRLIISRMVGTS